MLLLDVDIRRFCNYTDPHDVDEDLKGFTSHGGSESWDNRAGMFIRQPDNPLDITYSGGASRCRHPKLIKYYTDLHDVDESMMTIVHHGGEWWRGSNAGITHRDVAGEPSTISDVAASRRRHLKMFIYYTDWHDVDENERTNVSQGGMWTRGNQAGIALRYITDTSSHTSDTVASLKNK